MGTWIRRPDANGVSCDCRPAVCDPCGFCPYFETGYIQIAGYTDTMLSPVCSPPVPTLHPPWNGVLYQQFGVTAPCFFSAITPGIDQSLNAQTELLYAAVFYYDEPDSRWKMRITKWINSSSSVIEAWSGQSIVAPKGDPDGVTVTRQSGCCSGPGSITIQRVL